VGLGQEVRRRSKGRGLLHVEGLVQRDALALVDPRLQQPVRLSELVVDLCLIASSVPSVSWVRAAITCCMSAE
jgi:hypothetical protein